MKVRVTYEYVPEPDEIDPDDRTGLTAAAYDRLMDDLMQRGAEDTTVEAVPDSPSPSRGGGPKKPPR